MCDQNNVDTNETPKIPKVPAVCTGKYMSKIVMKQPITSYFKQSTSFAHLITLIHNVYIHSSIDFFNAANPLFIMVTQR